MADLATRQAMRHRGHPGVPRRGALKGLGGIAAGPALGGALGSGVARAQAEVVEEELRIIAFETFYGLDPVHEFSGGYLRSFGAAEALMRFTAFGQVEPDLAQSADMLDPYTWKINLRPEA